MDAREKLGRFTSKLIAATSAAIGGSEDQDNEQGSSSAPKGTIVRSPMMQIMSPFQKQVAAREREESTASLIQAELTAAKRAALTRRSDSEILQRLDSRYYEADFDPVADLFVHPDLLEGDALDQQLQEKDQILDIVNAQLSSRVMNSYNAFVQGMAQVRELSLNLSTAAIVCKNGRRHLHKSKEEFTSASFVIIQKHRKLMTLTRVVKTLQSVQKLIATKQAMMEKLESGDYPKAIELSLECRDAVSRFKQLHSVHELAAGLQENYALMETRLNDTLLQLTTTFKGDMYERTLKAYFLLGKGYVVMEKLQEHFMHTLNENMRRIALEYAIKADQVDFSSRHRMIYKQLCATLKEDYFVGALLAMLSWSFSLLQTHYRMHQWHLRRSAEAEAGQGEHDSSQSADKKRYADIEVGLKRFRSVLWEGVQQKVSILLSEADANGLQVEEFLFLARTLHKFVDVGEEFSDSLGKALLNATYDMSREFFNTFHRMRMEDIRTLLENEVWQPVPMTKDFQLGDIKEIRAVVSRHPVDSAAKGLGSADPLGATRPHDSASRGASTKSTPRYFASFSTGQPDTGPDERPNPFLPEVLEAERARSVTPGSRNSTPSSSGRGRETSDAGADSDDDVDEALKQEYIDEDTPTTHHRPAQKATSKAKPRKAQADPVPNMVVTSTAVNTARLLGKYVSMMRALEPVAFDIFRGLAEIFELFCGTVFSAFAKPGGGAPAHDVEKNALPGMGLGATALQMGAQMTGSAPVPLPKDDVGPGTYAFELPQRLTAAVTRIRDQAATMAGRRASGASEGPLRKSLETDQPPVAASIGLAPMASAPINDAVLSDDDPLMLYGLRERVCAVESLSFLVRVYEAVQPSLRAVKLSPQQFHLISQFYTQVLTMEPEVRAWILKHASLRTINTEPFAVMTSSVNWAPKEFGTEHNAYVETILREYQKVSNRLTVAARGFPSDVIDVVWSHIIERGMQHLVEGFSRAKRCNNEGRALMSLDLKTLQMGLEQLCRLRPLPGIELVDGFVKAFYLPSEQDLLAWYAENPQYSVSQITALAMIGVGAKLKKKARSDLVRAIEDTAKQAHSRRNVVVNLDVPGSQSGQQGTAI